MAILVFGLVIAVLAGASAYLITLQEMHHHFPSGRRSHREAWHAAVVTAGFFAVLAVILAFTLPIMFSGS